MKLHVHRGARIRPRPKHTPPGWWLVAGGWWLVAGGWWLAAGGWWLVAGAAGFWLLIMGAGWIFDQGLFYFPARKNRIHFVKSDI